MDGKEALKTAIPKLKADGFSFSANARKTLDGQIGSLRLDNIKLTAAKTDFSDIEQKRKQAVVNAENIMRAQSDELEKEVKNVGLTIIPLRLFINDKGFAKLDIGLAKGKKLYDKRDTIKDRDNKRHLDRIKKNFR